MTWVAVAPLVVLVVAIDVWALVDLRRREPRHLPRWLWAVLIIGSFPAGPLAYALAGRGEPRVQDDPTAIDPSGRPSGAHVGTSATAVGRIDAGRSHVHPTDLTGAVSWPSGPPTDTVIEIRSLVKTFGDTTALDHVDLNVPRGQVYGLIGPNGAGKTTVLSILAGLKRADSGEVHLAVPRSRVALLVDTPAFESWLTAYEVVDLARHLTAPDGPPGTAPDRVTAALATVGLADVMHRRVGGFSRGMSQRLGLAACLVGAPEVLVLDEPSSALDPAGRREVLDLIGQLTPNVTVMLSTHVLADVQQVCDVVGVIDRGRVRYEGPIHELLARTSAAYTLQLREPPPTSADQPWSPPALAGLVRAIEARPWASAVHQDAPGRIRVVVTDAVSAELELPRLVADAGVPLVSMQPATDLETAFLELTR